MTQQDDVSGIWNCRYWYPSNAHPGEEEVSEYEVHAEQTGNQLILQSIPNATDSYILIRLIIDGVYASGSWTENTSPSGEFAGMIYSGVVQLLIDNDGQRMRGKWVGVGRDLVRQQPDVYEGRWELTRV
ncbi:MAG TPA: hypothetical protein VF575_02720 [Candidatus Saccharimonadales bacterium]|jgi:hypothetical protein